MPQSMEFLSSKKPKNNLVEGLKFNPLAQYISAQINPTGGYKEEFEKKNLSTANGQEAKLNNSTTDFVSLNQYLDGLASEPSLPKDQEVASEESSVPRKTSIRVHEQKFEEFVTNKPDISNQESTINTKTETENSENVAVDPHDLEVFQEKAEESDFEPEVPNISELEQSLRSEHIEQSVTDLTSEQRRALENLKSKNPVISELNQQESAAKSLPIPIRSMRF